MSLDLTGGVFAKSNDSLSPEVTIPCTVIIITVVAKYDKKNVCTHVAMHDFITSLQYSLQACEFGVEEAEILGDILSHASRIQSIK
ncbi:MAG: hypothetical protein MJE68_16260 [Proteobacteria bacterium]|nr:hypothetical protein [Pseudomonadota bacterium]